jgi:hypothetical protein
MPKSVQQQYAIMAIKALGGSTKLAELFGLDERLVSNWRRRGLPPDTYVAMAPLLTALGREAPPIMWRQRMLMHQRVKRPPRPNVNGKAQHR